MFIVNRSPSLNFSLNIVTIKLATLDTDRKEEEDKGGGGGKGETRARRNPRLDESTIAVRHRGQESACIGPYG